MLTSVVATAVVCGTVIGFGAATLGQSGNPPTSRHYPVNDDGQTVGRVPDPGPSGGAVPIDEMPDLVAVVGDSGVNGYARLTDLLGEEPADPSEALAAQDSQGDHKIPVFAEDGRTRIDWFTIEEGQGHGSTDPEK